ncbi:Ig-like domain-containing protein [Dokdonia sp. Hel_I_53]|uniref:DUF7507 domain-containing protein n=1 Tax=Dokdonia sp. Hel_I_53 TaxID=1566287 RepID=UPI001198F951|nr:Ig-like domain-containing protein [Dokdonia sp. Hel_I_53]TVZ51640.1 putative repeat protein (TIGR01451 family)/gliding motility-associated-like protein [Dokdonia sp. Hel_I_53]
MILFLQSSSSIPFKRSFLSTLLLLFTFCLSGQTTPSQSPSIRSGVTFQWSDVQDTNGNNDVSNGENNRPATISSIIINGEVYNTFATPSDYELTRLGPQGHNDNGILENGNLRIGQSGGVAGSPASTQWNSFALRAFQDKNLNHYFTSVRNGEAVCGQFSAAASPTAIAQKQSLDFNPALPSNTGGILAVTERGGNNCYYIEMYGIPIGGGPVTKLGETFVRTQNNYRYRDTLQRAPINNGTDYWVSGRSNENGQNIAIALFNLNSIAPTGSKITRIDFVAATRDPGDGKFFILQQYAVDGMETGCLNTPYEGNIDLSNTAPENSSYALIPNSLSFDPPSTNGNGSLNFNSSGSYTYSPPVGYAGAVSFDYEVNLPAPNSHISDSATITLNFVDLPEAPIAEPICQEGTVYSIQVNSPLGNEYEYALDGEDPFVDRSYQSSPLFISVPSGEYKVSVRNKFTNCFSTETSVTVLDNLEISGVVSDGVCTGANSGSIDITVSGGVGPYTYEWIGPSGFTSTDEDLANLDAVTYEITVTDSKGCIEKKRFTVQEPSVALSANANPTAILCKGESTGSIDLTVSGGMPSYSYAWSGPSGFTSTDEDLVGLVAGTYSVTITDDNGCTITINTIEIDEPSVALSANANPTAILCKGESTGSIDLTVSGGMPSYSYAWSGPSGFTSTDEDLVGLVAGTYSVTITDDNGCSITINTVEIDEPSVALSAIANPTAVLCKGESTGSIDLTVSGGMPSYSYSWSGPSGFTSTDEDLVGLVAGTYSVTITDDNGCSITINTVEIDEPSVALSAIANPTAVLCKGESTGSIDLTVSGGMPSYSYSWSGPSGFTSTDEDLISLVAGTYSVTITDDNGCSITINTVEIDEPSVALSAIANPTAVLCKGESTGSIDLTVSGGVPSYSYAWSGPSGFTSTDEDLVGLVAGTYSVTITDDNGCTITISTVEIDEPSVALSAIANPTAVLCKGESTGSIDLTVSGGTASYSYAWSGPSGFTSTDEDLVGLVAGTYSVTITDDNGCTIMISTIEIDEPSVALSAIANPTAVLCKGESTGSIDLTVSGGVPSYSYAWSGPSGFTSTDEDLVGLVAGTYSVTITDDNGCTITISTVEIDEPSVALSAIANPTAVLCKGESTGSIDLTVSGGTASYSYAWSGPSGFTSTDEDLVGLVAGTYSVTITDDNGCTIMISTIEIDEPSVALSAIANPTAVLCKGESTGSIDLTVSGGVPSYSYAWSGPSGFTSIDEDLVGLVAGTYSVTITDDNGCTITISTVEIDEPSVALSAIANPTAVLCKGESTGSIDLTVSGGVPSYSYAWSGPSGFTSTDEDLVGLVAGTYSVTITDDNGCSITINTVEIDEPSVALSAIANATAVLCKGESTGSIDLIVSGGTASYSYAWSGPSGFTSTDEDLVGLVAGTYSVTITDDNGCAITISTIEIDEPSVGLTANANPTAVLCKGESTGSIDLTVSGGVPSYSYAWSGPSGFTSTDEDLVGLVAGTYSVTITDNNGCTITISTVEIDEPSVALSAIANPTAVLCKGESTGSIDLTVSGGTASYSYAWSGPSGFTSTDEDLVGLIAGTYSVTITDDNGCTIMISTIEIDEPLTVLTGNITSTNENGATANDGTATITVSGGIPNYTYLWSPNGETTPTIINLDSGTYSVIVTDQNGCIYSETVTITSINQIPVAQDDNVSTLEDTTITIDVLQNDSFGSDGSSSSNISITALPVNGFTVVNLDNTIEYIPGPNFVGTDEFIYEIEDSNGDTAFAKASVIVNAVVDAVDDIVTTAEDTPVTFNVFDNDLFIDTNFEVTSVTNPNKGTVTFTVDGTMIYTPDSNFNGSDQFDYTVTVQHRDGLTTNEETATVYITVVGDNPSIQLYKDGNYFDANNDGIVSTGDEVNYVFTVVNTGDVILFNTTISDPLPGVIISGGPITLDVGESDSTSFSGTYTITQADIDAGTVVNLASVTAEEPGNDPSDPSDDITDESEDPTPVDIPSNPDCPFCTETPLEQVASLSLIKNGLFMDESADGFAQVGETIEYIFTVSNNGNVTITDIIIIDPLVTVIGGPIDLSPEESNSTTFTASYVITQEDINNGSVENQALAIGQDPDETEITDLSDDDSELEDEVTLTELPVGASISLIKSGVFNDESNDGFAQEGETITYTFILTNTGNVSIINIAIEDPLVPINGGPISLDPQEIDNSTFTATYTITAVDILNGFVVNQAIATGQDPSGNDVVDISDDDSELEDEETITILPRRGNIYLEKTGIALDVNGDGLINVGEVIRYSFTVTNSGLITITDITISDPLVPVEGGPITLLSGESDSTTFSANYVVTQTDIEEGLVINQATVSGVDENNHEVSDLSDDPTDLTNNDLDGDGDPDDPTIVVFQGVLNIADIEVFNGISPNGDGRNDYFMIQGIENYPNNNVQIFNRWGVQVFDINGYTNNDSTKRWDGTSNARATMNSEDQVPSGTYYYIIEYDTPDGTRNKAGYLYVN